VNGVVATEWQPRGSRAAAGRE